MEAVIKMALDTVWGNKLTMEVDAELDNSHTALTRELASLMLGTLRIMAEEARAENERFILQGGIRYSDAVEEEGRERGVMERMRMKTDET